MRSSESQEPVHQYVVHSGRNWPEQRHAGHSLYQSYRSRVHSRRLRGKRGPTCRNGRLASQVQPPGHETNKCVNTNSRESSCNIGCNIPAASESFASSVIMAYSREKFGCIRVKKVSCSPHMRVIPGEDSYYVAEACSFSCLQPAERTGEKP